MFNIGLLLALVCNLFGETASEVSSYEKVIKFVNSYPTKADETRCSYIDVNRDHFEYIIEIKPQADMNIAHHLTLTGCEYLPELDKAFFIGNTWQCDEGSLPICGENGRFRRLFTWALNADGLKFQPGVGYRIGGTSGMNYLVMQTHYKDKLPINQTDNSSSYHLTITNQTMPFQVGVYTLGNDGFIPSRTKNFQFDSGCPFELPFEIVPIYYRVHTHDYGTVVSGYLVRNNTWTELGRMSPQQKQQFYPVSTKSLLVDQKDHLVSKCTYDTSSKEDVTYTGQSHKDEMCVFYLMFYTSYSENIYGDYYCYNDGNSFNVKKELNITSSFPANSFSLDGVKLKKDFAHSHSHSKR